MTRTLNRLGSNCSTEASTGVGIPLSSRDIATQDVLGLSRRLNVNSSEFNPTGRLAPSVGQAAIKCGGAASTGAQPPDIHPINPRAINKTGTYGATVQEYCLRDHRPGS